MTFVALEQSAMAHEGRGDGPAPIITAQIITLDSGPEGAQILAKILNGDFWRVHEPWPRSLQL